MRLTTHSGITQAPFAQHPRRWLTLVMAMGLFEHQDYWGQARFVGGTQNTCGNLTNYEMQNPAFPQDPLGNGITWNDQVSSVGVYPNTPLLDNSSLNYSTGWTPSSPWPRAVNNTVSFSDQTNATADYWFYGTGVTWIFTLANNRGIGNIKVTNSGGDVVYQADVDLYNPNIYWQRWHSVINLPRATYHLIITVTGTRNGASSGTYVDVDALLVHP